MKTFKNKAAQNNEAITTVFFAQGEMTPSEFGEWVEVDELELLFAKHNTHLFTQANIKYFGKI